MLAARRELQTHKSILQTSLVTRPRQKQVVWEHAYHKFVLAAAIAAAEMNVTSSRNQQMNLINNFTYIESTLQSM